MADQLWAKAPANLIRDPDLTLTDLRVYLELDLRAGRRGWWWGTQRELAEHLSASVRSVREAVAKLRHRGYISTRRTQNRHGAITYTIHARSGTTLPIMGPPVADRIGDRLPNRGDRIGEELPNRGGRIGGRLPNRRDRSFSGSQKITSEQKIPGQSTSPSVPTDWSVVLQAHRDKLDEAAG